MIKFAKSKFNNQVFIPSILMILLITLFATIFPQYSKEFFQNLQNFITAKFGWFYVLAIAIIVVCMLILGFSKFGEIKLGADHAKPEYKNISWFAMLFAAGMGIGLVFFDVSEPLMHFLSPPSTNGESISAQSLAIFALSAIMFLKLKFEVSELITGTIGFALILAAFLSSLVNNRRNL